MGSRRGTDRVNATALFSKNVLLDGRPQAAGIVMQDGLVKSIIDYSEADRFKGSFRVLDSELHIGPGLIDVHVHLNEPGRAEWEGFYTGTQAAAAGGVTLLIDMPLNCSPVTTNGHALATKREVAQGKCFVDVGFWGGMIPGQSAQDILELIEGGVFGVKCFLIDSGLAEFPYISPGELQDKWPSLQGSATPLLIHAELDSQGCPAMESSSQYSKFLESRPDHWEVDAIKTIVDLQKKIGPELPAHIVHLSSAQAIEVIQKARSAGHALSVETCPHYLCLDAESIGQGETLYKCCPPIRSYQNQLQLWEALKNQTLDFIASDHSPCTVDLKKLESGDFAESWGGISSLQLTLPLIWSQAREREISIWKIFEWLSSRPAEWLGLGRERGKIAPGSRADFVVWNPNAQFSIQPQDLLFKNKVTPYANKTLFGLVEETLLSGKTVYCRTHGPQGPFGQLIKRTQE